MCFDKTHYSFLPSVLALKVLNFLGRKQTIMDIDDQSNAIWYNTISLELLSQNNV